MQGSEASQKPNALPAGDPERIPHDLRQWCAEGRGLKLSGRLDRLRHRKLLPEWLPYLRAQRYLLSDGFPDRLQHVLLPK